MSISDFAKSDHSPATVNSFMTFATDYIPLVLKLRSLAGEWSLFYFCQLIQVSKISLPQIIIEYYLCILKLVRWSEISIQYGPHLIGRRRGGGAGGGMYVIVTQLGLSLSVSLLSGRMGVLPQLSPIIAGNN